MNILAINYKMLAPKDFVMEYAQDIMDPFGDNTLFQSNNPREINNLLKDHRIDCIVLYLDYIYKICSVQERKELYEGCKNIHIIVIGSSRQFSELSAEEKSIINVFYNQDENAIQKYAKLEEQRKNKAIENEIKTKSRIIFQRMADNQPPKREEEAILEKFFGIKNASHRLCILKVSFYRTEEAVLNHIYEKRIESFVEFDSETKIVFVQSDKRSYYGIICYPVKRYREKSDWFIKNYCRCFREKCKNTLGIEPTIGVSSRRLETDKIFTQFVEANIADFNYVYDGIGKTFYFEECKSDRIQFNQSAYLLDFQKRLRTMDIHTICQGLSTMFDEVKRAHLLKEELQALLVEVMSLIYNFCVEKNVNMEEVNELGSGQIEYSFIYSIESVEEEKRSFIEFCARILTKIAERENVENQYGVKVRKAIKYIYDHYADNLTLSSIAEYLGLSSNYFSSLFRKETGESVINFVNGVRVEKAKVLLLSTDYNASLIGELVGIEDNSYFCTLFKKHTGESVSSFRKNNK